MGGNNSLISNLANSVFPRMPNFYSMILAQCELVTQSSAALVEFMQTNSKTTADTIIRLDEEEDALKARHLEVLADAFATPLDREDLQRAITSVGVTMKYAATIVQEMQTLTIQPGPFSTEMAILLLESNKALYRGYKKLGTDATALAENDAHVAVRAKHNLDQCFRRALADLFDTQRVKDKIKNDAPDAKMAALVCILDIFKQREIYRHLVDSAHELSQAGNCLHDIVVKIS
ncbi:MAG: DUF47 domain-containing protein [Magnetococcales bacterium]|nr:DUF47 domain-containing protein [Magnetococcales bacterium]